MLQYAIRGFNKFSRKSVCRKTKIILKTYRILSAKNSVFLGGNYYIFTAKSSIRLVCTRIKILVVKGTVRWDWNCMKVIELDRPRLGHKPLQVHMFYCEQDLLIRAQSSQTHNTKIYLFPISLGDRLVFCWQNLIHTTRSLLNAGILYMVVHVLINVYMVLQLSGLYYLTGQSL
jgi:hypothetical protein